jgi:hypothetical protein
MFDALLESAIHFGYLAIDFGGSSIAMLLLMI